MCLGEGRVSFSVLPYAFSWSLGKLQPVSFMPSMALTQHCLVWRGMRIAQDLTWRVTETYLTTWLMWHPVFSSLSPRLSQCSTWKKIQWKALQLQCRQTSNINQKRSHTTACVPEAGVYNPIRKTYVLFKWSFSVKKDSCIRGWHWTPDP